MGVDDGASATGLLLAGMFSHCGPQPSGPRGAVFHGHVEGPAAGVRGDPQGFGVRESEALHDLERDAMADRHVEGHEAGLVLELDRSGVRLRSA